MFNWLEGKKTYVAAACGAAYGVLITVGLTPNRVGIWATITSIGIIGVRSVATKLLRELNATTLPVILNDGDDSIHLTETKHITEVN